MCFELGLRAYHLINVDNLLRVYQLSQAGQMEPNIADIIINIYNKYCNRFDMKDITEKHIKIKLSQE